MEIKNLLKTYITNYPNSFVGFFESLSSILNDLGQEWIDYGRKEWGNAFIECSNQTLAISKSLSKLRDEYNKEQLDNNPVIAIQAHINVIKEIKNAYL